MFSIIFLVFTVLLGATVFSQLFNVNIVNMTIDRVGKLEVGGIL